MPENEYTTVGDLITELQKFKLTCRVVAPSDVIYVEEHRGSLLPPGNYDGEIGRRVSSKMVPIDIIGTGVH